jgi:hypothetical protein
MPFVKAGKRKKAKCVPHSKQLRRKKLKAIEPSDVVDDNPPVPVVESMNHPLKYSCATPHATYQSLIRTINSGSPPEQRIIADCDRIINSTLQRIIDARGCYIDDSASKTRNGKRAAAAAVELSHDENLKVDPELENLFYRLIDDMDAGKCKVPLVFDVTTQQDDHPLEFVEVGVGEGEVDDEEV